MKVINPTEVELLTQGERYALEQKLKKIFQMKIATFTSSQQ